MAELRRALGLLDATMVNVGVMIGSAVFLTASDVARAFPHPALQLGTWVVDASRRGTGAGGALDRVEIEDEQIVEQVQRGVRSRLYDRGRYSPAREPGVHHFHRLLARLSG